MKITAATGSESNLTWRSGAEQAAWPDDLTFADGTYMLRREDRPQPIKLMILQIPASIEAPGAVAAWMADHGCQSQAMALINSPCLSG